MKRKFAIVTDSAADMPKEFYEEHGVEVIPLGFTMNGIPYEGECGERIDEKTFYGMLRKGAMPTTYQATAEIAKPHIEKYLENGQDVLIVAFSSALSGTCGSFQVAARELSKAYPKRKILVVDSLCASMGQGLFLHYVLQKAEESSLEETAAYAEEIKLRICHHFTVDSLFHLKRGGRVGTLAAIFGSVLKIKPIMHVDNQGKLTAIGKVIGRKKSLTSLVNNLFESMDEEGPIFISHGDCLEEVEFVKGLILERKPNAQLFVNYIGAVIGSHSGAGTLAIFNLGKSRE